MKKNNTSETRNLLIALIISSVILGVWQYMVEMPRKKLQAEALRHQAVVEQQVEIQKQKELLHPAPEVTREEYLSKTPSIQIASDKLHGSFSLKGLRFNNLTLAHYRETLDPASPEVILFSPAYSQNGYFSEIGWMKTPDGPAINLPDKNSEWKADTQQMVPNKPVTLTWKNPENITFTAVITLDDHYMFSIKQSAKDAEGNAIAMQTYAYINRVLDLKKLPLNLVHEGPIAVYNGVLKNVNYKDTAGGKHQTAEVQSGGWVGISDKYWFSAIIPTTSHFTSRIFSYTSEDGRERFQADYSSVAPEKETTFHLFAGAKELEVMDVYAKQYSIPLFDRAVDFGMFYWLTKPIFKTLTFFHSLVGNFGIAILLLTVLVKIIMYPLADKSYKSMAQMSIIRPKMIEIQERFKDDKQKLNMEMIDLYKREKVNPASGCLPALLQIPVFLSLYNTLYVTIEMRHAPFYGWIHDLSAPDPTNFFTLFGLLQWAPPSLLHVGIWPALMAVTMYIQQQQSPPPPDPTHAKMMKWLPVMFLFMFSSVASGLVIYWTWSNVISIVQQWHIKHRHEKKKLHTL